VSVRRLGPALAAAASLAAADAPRFEPPAPGSYELPPIRQLQPHTLLDASGREAPVVALGAGEAALVSFIYLSCPDHCPLATATMQRLDRVLARDAALAGRVELVTVSFDPANDTPERLRAQAEALAPKGRWRFLTARDASEIAPVLADFGQDAVRLRAANGDTTGRIRHVLKVFLVDAEGRVRNVYSTGMLDERLVVADLVTLLGPAR
jgi:cytochrome oxidase Cu insertion factor (SCO1/SenC/PrrC family)